MTPGAPPFFSFNYFGGARYWSLASHFQGSSLQLSHINKFDPLNFFLCWKKLKYRNGEKIMQLIPLLIVNGKLALHYLY